MIRRLAPLSRLLLAGALVLTVAGTANAASNAWVRVLHASPDAPAVDVYLDDTIVGALTNVPFGTLSDYLEIPAGAHNVKVYATGDTTTPVIDADVSFGADTRTTIAATSAVASIQAQVLVDKPAPSCDTAQVRVVHFSADAPAVDIATTGADPADAVIQDLAYPSASDYLKLPAGSYDLEVRVAGTTTVALALPGVAVKACNSYSVFAIGSAATPAVGGNALQVVVGVDATAQDDGAGAPPPAGMTAAPTDTVAEGSASGGMTGVWAALLAVGALTAVVVTLRPVVLRARRDRD
jgi:hypothetical protein